MPLHNLHFLLSESIYRQQHICSNLVTLKDLQDISGKQLFLQGYLTTQTLAVTIVFEILLNGVYITYLLFLLYSSLVCCLPDISAF